MILDSPYDDILATSKNTDNTTWIGEQLKNEFGEIKEQYEVPWHEIAA